MGAGASSGTARSLAIVPVDGSGDISGYLAKVKTDNQWITDSLSGVRITIAHT